MQSAIAVLILGNLLVLLWSGFQSTDSPKALGVSDTGDLRLLTEYARNDADSPKPTQANTIPAIPPVSKPQPQQIAQSQPSSDTVRDALPGQPGSTPLPAVTQGAQLAQNDFTGAQTNQQWSTQAQETEPDFSVDKINLPPADADQPEQVVEQPPEKQQAVTQAPSEAPPEPKAAETPKSAPSADSPAPKVAQPPKPAPPADAANVACWRIGSFSSASLAEQAAAKRPQNMRLIRIAQESETAHLGYIVVVPAKNGLEGAEQTVRQLQRKGINDFQIMKKGPFIHAVSLGVFNEKLNAQRWVRHMHKKGLPQVVMRERTDNRNKYWLELGSAAKIAAPDILQPIYADVGVRQINCQ